MFKLDNLNKDYKQNATIHKKIFIIKSFLSLFYNIALIRLRV
jgi:hypothetical protein